MPLQTVGMLGHTTHVPSHPSWLFQTSPAPMSQNRLSSEMDPRFAFPLPWPRLVSCQCCQTCAHELGWHRPLHLDWPAQEVDLVD